MAAHEVNSEEHDKKVSAKVLDYLQKGRCGDVVLVSKRDGRRMWAHRMVLSACSEYFEKIFMNKESIIEKIELEVEGKVLGALMLYCYFGKICELEKIAEDLMVAAGQYQMQPVVDACELYLANNLEKSNCLAIMKFTERNKFSDLLEKAKTFVYQHFMEVSNSEKFLQLSFENVQRIIASDELQVKCEEDVLNSVLSWLQHDWSNRRDDFLPLMECIRLSLLPNMYLKEKFWGSDHKFRDLKELMERHFIMKGTIPQFFPDTPRKGSSAILMVVENHSNPQKKFYDLQSFCPQSRLMKKWSNLPDDRRHFGVALLGQNLIIAGGHLWDALTTAFMQDLETKKWTSLRCMQTKRQCFSLVALNEFVYAIGGNYKKPLNTVERLDMGYPLMTWRYVAPMSCCRGGLAAAALEGQLYVAGGFTSSVTEPVESYDMSTNTWTDGASMKNSGSFTTSVTNSVECYDPKTNKWTQRAPMISARMFFTAVAANGYLYVLGGEGRSSYLSTVERYDPQANKWTQLCSLSLARRNLAATIIGNRIFAIGGETKNASLSSLEEFNIATNKWTKLEYYGYIIQTITVPNFYSLNSTSNEGSDIMN